MGVVFGRERGGSTWLAVLNGNMQNSNRTYRPRHACGQLHDYRAAVALCYAIEQGTEMEVGVSHYRVEDL